MLVNVGEEEQQVNVEEDFVLTVLMVSSDEDFVLSLLIISSDEDITGIF